MLHWRVFVKILESSWVDAILNFNEFVMQALVYDERRHGNACRLDFQVKLKPSFASSKAHFEHDISFM